MQVINLPTGNGDEVKLSGKLDSRFSSRIRALLRVKVKEKHSILILDCSASESIDAFGAAPFIEYMQDAKKFNGRLALIGLNPKLKRFFELLHLSDHLPIYDNRAAAKNVRMNAVE